MTEKETRSKLLIFSEKHPPRMTYIFNLILKDILGLSPVFTSDAEEFKASPLPKMSYGFQNIDDEFFVAADNLLFERGISDVTVSVSKYKELPCFFTTYHKKSAFPFDIFAASFYLVSRYEEYLPFLKDKYGRFDANQSLAYKHGFLYKPLVNIWANDLGDKLLSLFPELQIKKRHFRYLPTIDIDAAYAFKQKGYLRTIGGYLKDLKTGDFRNLMERTRVLRGRKKDPFDSFDYIFDLHRKFNLEPIFFVLFADYGTNDKNLPTFNRKFQSLVRRLGDYGEIGIHPSFNSNFHKNKLSKEIAHLSRVVHSEITKSRQHFLMLSMPDTYNNLIDNGIAEDYSMGFASKAGFRAGICSEFYFYNLEYEMVTPLKINPFTYMEGSFKDYMNLEPEQALEEIKKLMDEVKAVGGTFISLWHNESLGGEKRWKGWPEIYEQSLEYAAEML